MSHVRHARIHRWQRVGEGTVGRSMKGPVAFDVDGKPAFEAVARAVALWNGGCTGLVRIVVMECRRFRWERRGR